VAVRSKASGRRTATLDVWGGAGGVIRHQHRRRRPQQSAGEATGVNCRQRTKTSRLVRRHFNAHICSSANFGSRNFSWRNFFLSPRILFETRLDRDSLTSLSLGTSRSPSMCCWMENGDNGMQWLSYISRSTNCCFCLQNNPASAKHTTRCPFNAKHVVPKVELAYHQMVCPDRALVDREILNS